MKKCKFCQELANSQRYSELPQRYSVAMVQHSIRPDGTLGGRLTDYRWRGLGYKLNFCPECGRRLWGKRGSRAPSG